MGGKSQPNMQGAAIAQGDANRQVVTDQTFANRPDQYTPFGSTTWDSQQQIDPATGQPVTGWQQTTSLTPQLQSILNKQLAVQDGRSDIAGMLTGRLGGEFGESVNFDNLNPMGEVPVSQLTLPEQLRQNLDYSSAPQVGDPRDLRQRAENAVFDKGQGRLNDRFGSQRQQMEIKLRNQGLSPLDEAYQSQMQGIDLAENDAMGQLQSDAVMAGRGEQAQLFGQDVGLRSMATGEQDRIAQFGNQAAGQMFNQALGANAQNFGQAMQGSQYATQLRQQQQAEEMQRRGFSLNEINALLSGQQVGTPQMPNFSQAAAAQSAPLYQAAADQSSINAANNPTGALLGLGGSFLGAAGAAGGFGNLFG